MDNKKLLESLRSLTPSIKLNEEDELEDKKSIEDILDDSDENDDDDSTSNKESDDDESDDDYEEEEEEEEESDDDSEHDIHSLNILKKALNSSDDLTRHSIITLARLIVDNDIKSETIEQFLDEVDTDHDESDDDDEFDEPMPDDEEAGEADDEEAGEAGDEDEAGEEGDADESESFEEDWDGTIESSHFLNEGAIAEEYEMKDFLE